MKFSCSKEALDRQLTQVARVVAIRHTLPILSNLLLETDGKIVRISGTDLELAITSHVPAKVEQEGAFTVPAKLFQDFVHQNPDENLTFTLEGVELICKSEKVQARITGIDPDEYPELPKVERGVEVTLPGEPFIEAVKQVVVAAANDPARPVLTGVFVHLEKEVITVAATDSFRLAEHHVSCLPVATPQTLLIPARTIQELARTVSQGVSIDQLKLTVGENQVIFHLGEVEIYSRLLNGKFPPYQTIIPKEFVAVLDVTSSEILQALRLTTIFSQAGITNAMLEVDVEGTLTISSYGSQKGSSKNVLYSVAQEGFQPIKAAFNTKFLLDAISAAGTDYVQLHFSGQLSPLVITTENPQYLQLVMPIRLDN